MLDTSAFLEGLLLGAGLFTSVGPKDAFVIKRSLSSPHLLSIALVCAGSDAFLIVLGTHGLSALLSRHAAVVAAALWARISPATACSRCARRSSDGSLSM
ncbi:LysE family transporter [Burkholderia cenocepacia]|uniref:LysE family transporter n=1 Tax=Burkholderia cenocepacia TaxID=95486 RepID=UPI002AB7B3E2|nr:LysE family transporter [Burkholderia cenocepacia]